MYIVSGLIIYFIFYPEYSLRDMALNYSKINNVLDNKNVNWLVNVLISVYSIACLQQIFTPEVPDHFHSRAMTVCILLVLLSHCQSCCVVVSADGFHEDVSDSVPYRLCTQKRLHCQICKVSFRLLLQWSHISFDFSCLSKCDALLKWWCCIIFAGMTSMRVTSRRNILTSSRCM